MIKAKLFTDEIVTLEKDCGCIIHNGPHWIYTDEMDRNYNLNEYYYKEHYDAFTFSELRRLQTKKYNMLANNVKEYWFDNET